MSPLIFGHEKSDDALVSCGLSPSGQSLERRTNGHSHPTAWYRPKALDLAVPTPVLFGVSLESAGLFETLLLGLVAEMARLPVRELEPEMGLALKRVCECFGLEWAALWHKSLEEPASLVPTHYFPKAGNGQRTFRSEVNEANEPGPQIAPDVMPKQAVYPWISAEVQRGKLILFCQVDNLPAEAAQDKASLSLLGIRSGLVVPFCAEGQVFGAVSFGMTTAERCWHKTLVKRLQGLAAILSTAAARQLSRQRLLVSEEKLRLAETEIEQLKERFPAENDFLEPELELVQAHAKILGRSPAILKVLHAARQVAPADCSVLITGATGTGKELIAQEIHQLSLRKVRAMVLVNCAALPSALVESELFGRERGAYTGALTSQVGRFELANDSTIFLDEIGELPMDVQAKLLRVLQHGEFERLGSPKTHKVAVRVIAATNRDLAEEVRKGKFREDLYYRLKVFPIAVPPLRERIEDIPLLVFAFMEEFAARMGKKVTRVPREAMEKLLRHDWPGNIRELRNVIEHSVIVSSDGTLKLCMLGETTNRQAAPVTLAQAEREHILEALRSTGWRIKGPLGAAQRLDLQPSTLYSRMQKLGIPNRSQKHDMTAHG